MKTEFTRRRPAVHVQQLGNIAACTEPLYAGCYELRTFFEGMDYWDMATSLPMGSVAKRKADGKIFAAPDYRFCAATEFDVLWLNERRKRLQ